MELRAISAVTFVVLVVFSGSVVAGPTDATATESPTSIDTCTPITEPGVYELTADIGSGSDVGTFGCIPIRSGNVTLDGNGHTIAGGGSYASIFVGSAHPSTPTAEYLPNVTIRDAVVTGEVELYRTPGVTVQNITVQDAHIRIHEGDGSALTNNSLSGTTLRGASISVFESDDSVVANNTVVNRPEYDRSNFGPASIRTWVSNNVTVRNNVALSNSTGLDIYGMTNSTFVDNVVVGREDEGVRIWAESRNNTFEGTNVSGSAVGIVLFELPAAETTFWNTTAINTTAAVLDARISGVIRLHGVRIASNTTTSVTGRNVVVRSVESPPSVPSGLTAVGGFVEVIQYRGANVSSLAVAYDEAAIETAGMNESDIRLYRYPAEDAPSHVYASMVSTAERTPPEGWAPVPGSSEVNTTANVVYADVTAFDFERLDVPADATRIDEGETVNGTLSSDESDWYAFEADAGELILPTLRVVGPMEDRAIRFSIVDSDDTAIEIYPDDFMFGDDYEVGAEWSGLRETTGRAMAEENGTYYVRVYPGFTNKALVPGAYNLIVETRKPVEPRPPEPPPRMLTATDSATTTK